MPFCRNCQSRISRFDKDLCPVCGVAHPLEGAESDTVEITTSIDTNENDASLRRRKSKKTLLILSCLLGFLGVGFFYLKYIRIALIWLFSNLVFIGGIFSIFYFAVHTSIGLAILIPLFTVYLFNIVTGIFLFFKPNFKDQEGVYLR